MIWKFDDDGCIYIYLFKGLFVRVYNDEVVIVVVCVCRMILCVGVVCSG